MNQPGDPFEQEADAVAESVAREGDGGPTTPHGGGAPRREAPPAAEPTVQPPDSGSALNRNVRARAEPVLGVDLGRVRVHDSPAARDAAGSIGARAFTHKNHIWLGPNESAEDAKLLTHEATHVLQQSNDGAADTGGHAPAIQRQTAVSSSSSSAASSSAAAPVAASMPEPTSSSAATLPESAAASEPGATTDPSRSAEAGGGAEGADGGEGADGAEGAGGGGSGEGVGGAPAGGEGGGAGTGAGGSETDAAGNATGAGGGAGGGAMSSEGATAAAPPVAETGAGALETGDLVLIDVELAEHQRWAGALGRVGAAGSLGRAEFIAEAVGSGFISGAASGLAMGLGIGLVSRAVPAIGPVIGGAMALHGLVSRDWAETGATIGRFGEGNSTYETLANTIASVAAVIDVVSQVLTVINGIVGIVQIAAAVIAGGAVVAAFFTFGATLGIAAVAADVVGVCEEISLGINAVTTVLDTVNAAILQPCVTLFRALHAFTTQADPREVEAQGHGISTAAANSGAALGAWAGGRAAHIGAGGAHPSEDLPPTSRPPHETPPPAAGDGPTVRFSEPAGAPGAHAEGGPAPAPHAEAPAPVAPVETGPAPAAHPEAAPPPIAPAEAVAPPVAHAEAPPPVAPVEAAPPPAAHAEGAAAAPPATAAAAAPVDVAAAGAAPHAPVDAAAAAGGGGAPGGGAPGGGGGAPGGGGPPAAGGGAGAPPPVEYALTGRRPEPGGIVIHEYGRPGVDTLEHLDVDATVAALDPDAPAGAPRATSDTFFELPAGRDTAPGVLPPHGLQDFDIRMNPNPAQIQYHENMSFEGVTTARIAEHGTVAPGERGGTAGAPGTPHTAGSVLPDDPGRVTSSAVPVRGPASPRAGEPWPVEVRTHSANPAPGLAAAAPHAHSRFNPTTQVNTSRGHYLLPDGRWVPLGHPDIGGGHYPVGGRDRGPTGLGEIPGTPGGVPTPPGPGPAPGGGGGAPPPPPGPAGGGAPPVAPAPPPAPPVAAPAPAPVHAAPAEPTSTPASTAGNQLSFAGMDAPSSPPTAAPHPGPTGPMRQPITPDVEIRGEFRDSSLRTVTSDQSGRASVVGEVGPHQWQGNRGGGVRESEHVIPGAQMRDASRDPARGNAPDWQRHAPQTDPDADPSIGRDYNRATTIVEHAVVSDRKTALDNPATRALQTSGGPRNPVDDLLLPSLARHQQAVDDAIAAGEITPAQATDPTHRALAAQAEMWGASETTGGAMARADADAAGTSVSYPRRPDRARDAEAARARARLAGEHIEEPDWEATFPNPNRSLPPGTQLALPGMEHLAPRPAAGPAPEQLSLPGVSTHPSDPNQLSLPFGRPPAGPASAPPTTTPPPTSGPPSAVPTPAAPVTPAPAPHPTVPPEVPTPPHTPTPPTATTPPGSPTPPASTPPAPTSGGPSTSSAAAGAARTAAGTPATGATGSGGEVSWGTRAHQVGELFLPQVFGSGGEAPTYAQQQAAHRARFTDDNQPAEGVERVNPEYPPPPATPAEINAVQDEIMNLLTVRAAAEQEAENQSGRADRCEENQGPIRQTIDDTTAGISAVQAHDAAVARRTALNQEQQQRQQESQGLVAGYPSRATGLAALSVPLAAWEGFTSLASHLPGDAGESMLRMNQEARQMQDAFTQMGAEMLGVETAGPAREAELQGDQGRLESTAEQAEVSDGQLNTASEGAAGLQDANEAALAEANQREEAATGRADECTEGIDEREARADSLAEQLRAWAAAHAAARQAAIAATEQRLVSEGRTVLSRSER